VHTPDPGGFFSFEHEGSESKDRLSGFGFGDDIRLRDEFGNTWRGSAEHAADGTVRYTFRNNRGKTISGMAEGVCVTLRDEKGKTWRGFID